MRVSSTRPSDVGQVVLAEPDLLETLAAKVADGVDLVRREMLHQPHSDLVDSLSGRRIEWEFTQ
jgi:hypothetical protein